MAGAGRVMTGKVAVITGAAEGIGAGLVAGYRGRGWSVLASATILRPPNDPEVPAVEGDIADPAGADRVIDAALARFGRLDTLVNNAGMIIAKPFTDYTAADYAHVIGVSLTGFFWITQRAIAAMTTVRRARGQRLGRRRRVRRFRHARGTDRADRGRPSHGHPVAGGRVRLLRRPGQRHLPWHPRDSGPGQRHR